MDDTEYMARVMAMERSLYRVAHAILWNDQDCADAVQSAVFRGWLKRGRLRETKYLETWLTRILINECRDTLRRPHSRTLPLDAAREADAKEPPAADIDLQRALRTLPEKYRLPLLLHYLEGYPLKEIGGMLGIPEPLVKSRMVQARQQLKKRLESEETGGRSRSGRGGGVL